ncbi:MAG: glycosyltransferase family 2 protein, partial [Bryobacteraceae bacterium]|nr:glycosyltransferase family 2 protein [Bryobacteraceae bacterium]
EIPGTEQQPQQSQQQEQPRQERRPSVPHHKGIEVSVVLPLYNEAESLKELHHQLRATLQRMGVRYELIFVDDGSTDRSFNVLRDLKRIDGRVKIIRFRRNYGKSAALAVGFEHARYELVVTLDADLQDDPAEIPRLLAVLDEGYDLAYGSRLARGSQTTRSLKREIVSRGNMAVIKAMFFVRFSDAQCGFKAITREAARALLPLVKDTYWFFDTELLIKAEKAGYRLKEIPVRWQEDPDTRVKLVQDIGKQLRGLLRVRFERIPRREELVST